MLVIVLTGLYTTLGGMRAVAYNDAVQVIVLIGGSALLTFYGLSRDRRLERAAATVRFGHVQSVEAAHPAGRRGPWAPVMETNAAGQVVKEAWYFNGNFPWLGMLFCAPIIGLWYWCTDQYIVQRALGAPNETSGPPRQHLRGISEAVSGVSVHRSGTDLFRSGEKRQDPGAGLMVSADGKPVAAATQAAFPMMVQYLLPAGLRGIVVAGLLSALMGSLAGVFNACSTLFTVDLYQKWRPKASQQELVRTGRLATIACDRARTRLDPGDPRRARTVRLSAIGAKLPGPADLRRVLSRRVLAARQCAGLFLGAGRWLCARRHAHAHRYAGLSGDAECCRRLCAWIVALGRSTTSIFSTSAC